MHILCQCPLFLALLLPRYPGVAELVGSCFREETADLLTFIAVLPAYFGVKKRCSSGFSNQRFRPFSFVYL